MTRVLLLGSTGMLGRAVREAFAAHQAIGLVELNRTTSPSFDASDPILARRLIEDKFSEVGGFDFVINAIGLTKVGMAQAGSDASRLAKAVNVEFPRQLVAMCELAGAHVLTIGTDCIFLGDQGEYFEDSPADATDLYGESKRLGEVTSPNSTIIRSSFIGLQAHEASPMLLEWVIRQPEGASVNGYTNHIWNGTTAIVLGRVLAGMVSTRYFPAGTFHLVPNYEYSKLQLIRLIADSFGRHDLEVIPFTPPTAVDRRLGTRCPEISETLWGFVGADVPRKLENSILELAERRARERS